MSVVTEVHHTGRHESGTHMSGTHMSGTHGSGMYERVVPVRPRTIRRGEDVRRPGGRPLVHSGYRARVSDATHPRNSEEVGWGAVVLGAVALALVFAAFLAVAQWRGAASVPDATAVVQVRSGESLADVAERVAPGGAAAHVVERIVDLNALSGTGLHPGQSLIVPTSAPR